MASIEMKVPITFEIPEETVAQCLKVIEWWLNEDSDRDLVIHTVKREDSFYRIFEIVSKAEKRKEYDKMVEHLKREENR